MPNRANRIATSVGRRGAHLLRTVIKTGGLVLAGAALLLVLDAVLLQDDDRRP